MARGQEMQENTSFGSTPVKKYELIMNDGHRGPRLEPLPQTRPPLCPLLRYFFERFEYRARTFMEVHNR